ncbi:MAG: DUF4292 domain-containing protein [Weeksellaceae bacterium]|nr:DUF4292 domain-containing protein [Weeksellaceae bacterium]
MKQIILALTALLFVQCAVQPTDSGTANVENMNREAFFREYVAKEPNFEHLQIRGKVTANLNGKQNSASSRIYMQGDERIWVNLSMLGITGARANITPSRVQAYEVIDRTYIDGDFAFFNEKLKVDFINFERLQQLLLGRMLLLGAQDAYKMSVDKANNEFVVEYQPNQSASGTSQIFALKYFLDGNFRLLRAEMQDRNSPTTLTATYENWSSTAAGDLPGIVKVVIKGTQNDEITLEYNTFDLTPMDAPFNIPGNYSPREIN